MSDKTFPDDILNRLKQKLPLFVVLLTFLVVYYLVYFFTASDKSSMAIAASRTARAALPGTSTSQVPEASPTRPIATRAAGTPSPGPLSIDLSQTESAQGNEDVLSPEDNSTDQTPTGQNNSPATPTFPVGYVTAHSPYTSTALPPTTLAPAASSAPGLPGLSMSYVVARLQNEKKFKCEQVEFAPDPILWMCDIEEGEDLWYHVDLYGGVNVEVNNLMLNVVQTYPDEAKSLDMISFVASLPYKGSKPADASRWVAQTLPSLQSYDDVVEKIFGSVRFSLYGDPQDRYLEMGEPVVEEDVEEEEVEEDGE
jgi:hypothetical protein